MRWVNKLERTICYRKNKLTSGFHGFHDGPTWPACRLYPLPFMRLSCHWQYFRLQLSLKVGSLRIYSVFASLIHSYFDNVKSELINRKKSESPTRIQPRDHPNTGRALQPLSYENSRRSKSFNWVHVWQASCILLETALSKSSRVYIVFFFLCPTLVSLWSSHSSHFITVFIRLLWQCHKEILYR